MTFTLNLIPTRIINKKETIMAFIFTSPVATTEQPALHQIHIPAAWEQCEGFLRDLHGENDEVSLAFNAFSASVHLAYREGAISLNDTARIIRAVRFAAEKHQTQTRKNQAKSPYIIHPIGVASHLIDVGHVRDADILIAALLHDTVEDTNATFEEIKGEFGVKVEEYVREVTDDRSLPRSERKKLQIEHAPHKSPGASMVKLADKFYNLTDLSREIPREEDGTPWPKERVDGYFAWAKKVVDALPEVNPALKEAVDTLIAAHGQP